MDLKASVNTQIIEIQKQIVKIDSQAPSYNIHPTLPSSNPVIVMIMIMVMFMFMFMLGLCHARVMVM